MIYPTVQYRCVQTVATVALKITDLTAAQLEDRIKKYGYDMATITVETGGIRYSFDGVDPTTTVGNLVAAGGTLSITGKGKLQSFRMIRDGGTSASVTTHLDRTNR